MKTIKKICQECGEEFIARNGMQKFCDKQHYRVCKVCGKEFPVTRYHLTAKDARVTCSKECMRKLTVKINTERFGGPAPASSKEVQNKAEETNLKLYGVRHPAQAQQFKDKTVETNRAKFGCDYYMQTDEYKQTMDEHWKDPEFRERMLKAVCDGVEKKYGEGVRCVFSVPEIREQCRDTYEAKTGYREPFANPEVQKKSEETMLQNLGVRRALQSEECKAKWEATNEERFGHKNPMQHINVLRKAQATCKKLYGHVCYLQSNEGLEKSAETMLQKFGVVNYGQSREFKLTNMSDPSKIDNLIEFDEDPVTYIKNHFDNKPTLKDIAKSVGINDSSLKIHIDRAHCEDLIAYVYSYMEKEMYEAILSIDPDAVVDRNTHKIITPRELDLYLPDYNLGIECNPTSTHNSSEDTLGDGDPLPADYHSMKADLCDNVGVRLFHVYGSQWTYGKSILVSMLRDIMNKPLEIIEAHECEIKNVSENDRREFLYKNYLYGDCEASYCIGLYHSDELVELIVYNHDCVQCICHKLNVNVNKGPEVLINKLMKDLSLDIVNATSRRNTNEDYLFESLGFTKKEILPPNYVWVSVRTDLSYVPNSTALKQVVDCDVNDDEAMLQNRFNKVYDSGTITWEWRKE